MESSIILDSMDITHKTYHEAKAILIFIVAKAILVFKCTINVVGQIISPQWVTLFSIPTSFHVLIWSWGQLELYTLPTYLLSSNASYIPSKGINS